jgi:arginine utilization protein RocB
VSGLAKGMELTLGTKILKAVIFDRDNRSEQEVASVKTELSRFAVLAHIHERKELENYLLEAPAVERALKRQIQEHNRRSDDKVEYKEEIQLMLEALSEPMKHRVSAQFLAKRSSFEKAKNPALDQATITQRLLEAFEAIWDDWSPRRNMLPGKEFFSEVNRRLQDDYKVTLTLTAIIAAMHVDEVPQEIQMLVERLEEFRIHAV